MEYSLILSTTASRDEAHEIARALVDRKLVACVNILGPFDSIYRWKGTVESSQEYLLMIKTQADHFESVREAVRSLNSYDTPEVIQLPIQNGLPAYLQWVSESIS
jgi:periplasmic divalent cation tolerance protein